MQTYKKGIPKKTTPLSTPGIANAPLKSTDVEVLKKANVYSPSNEVVPVNSPTQLMKNVKKVTASKTTGDTTITTYATDDPNVVLVKNTKIITTRKYGEKPPTVQSAISGASKSSSPAVKTSTITLPPKPAIKPVSTPAPKPEPVMKPKSPEPVMKPKSPEPVMKPKLPDPVVKPKSPEPIANPKKKLSLAISKTSYEILNTPLKNLLKTQKVVKQHIPREEPEYIAPPMTARIPEPPKPKFLSTSTESSVSERFDRIDSKVAKKKVRRKIQPSPHIRPRSVFRNEKFIERIGCSCRVPPHNYCRCLVCKKLDFTDCPLLP